MIWMAGTTGTRWNINALAYQARPALLLAVLVVAVSLGTSGCVHDRSDKSSIPPRPFVFGEDNFSYANELVWVYSWDPDTGKASHKRREPPPTYSHHCFVVARAARQFFDYARFDPTQPEASPALYQERIRAVVAQAPGNVRAEAKRIVIPGYSNLFEFSRAHGELLQAHCGGAWRSYFQRGHWRMILPFSRRHQERVAVHLMEELIHNRPAVLHLVRFPALSINHAVLAYDYAEEADRILYQVYDPYSPEKPQTLTFCRSCRSFHFPANDYFVGGIVDVYQIYHRWNY